TCEEAGAMTQRKANGDRQLKRDQPARETARVRAWAVDDVNQIYGLMPVLEALRAGNKSFEQITIAEGARHERLRELLELARRARVPIHRSPRFALDRALPGGKHQGVAARISASAYRDADELLDELAARVGTDDPPLALGLDAVEDPRNL